MNGWCLCWIRIALNTSKHPPLEKVWLDLKKTYKKNKSTVNLNGGTVDGRNPANQLRLVVYPMIYRVSYIPGGCLGFQPSTLWLDVGWGKVKVKVCRCWGRDHGQGSFGEIAALGYCWAGRALKDGGFIRRWEWHGKRQHIMGILDMRFDMRFQRWELAWPHGRILLGNFGVMRFDMEIGQGTLGGGCCCFFFWSQDGGMVRRCWGEWWMGLLFDIDDMIWIH